MPTDIDALIADVLAKHELHKSQPGFKWTYESTAANAAPVLARELQRCREALKPFAAMDRTGGLLDHVVLERGTGSDKTILTDSDFRRAANALAQEVSDDQR